METTTLIMGVFAVITLSMVVIAFVNYTKTISLGEKITTLQQEREIEMINLDHEILAISERIANSGQSINVEHDKLYRHIDSRVDKAIDQVSRQISDVYRHIEDDKCGDISQGRVDSIVERILEEISNQLSEMNQRIDDISGKSGEKEILAD